MTKEEFESLKLPDQPGVYRFLDAKRKILYIGKATSLRDRVRSYFGNDVMHTRGKHIVDMVTLAETVLVTTTDSVLEALVLEASLIKRHQPYFNTKEKDNKSWNYVVITKESYPRIFTIRERTMVLAPEHHEAYAHIFGPFPQGGNMDEALRIIRKIFPFRTNCIPNSGAPCFDRQIGLCPGVCTGEIGVREYKERIREIRLFFEGKKTQLIRRLEKHMNNCAKDLEYEDANEYKHMIFSLRHIKDASLLREEVRAHSQKTAALRGKPFRIEAYDIAHISGKYTVGVMVVTEDGVPKKGSYRKFKIREDAEHANDTLHLAEVLRRRFAHSEWVLPDLIVIDGGTAQKNRATRVLREVGIGVPTVSVVKDVRHKPRAILGSKETAISYKRWILIANAESHRYAVAYHRQLRDKLG